MESHPPNAEKSPDSGRSSGLPPSARVLACRVFQPELAALGLGEDRVVYLDQGLHIHPDDLRQRIAQTLAEIEQDPEVDTVVLAYGYCGGGLEGLAGRRVRLVLPLIHDCIPLLLGHHPPGPTDGTGHTFYLSAGWVEHGRTPLSEYEETAQRWGHDDALWVGHEMFRGYKRTALIRHPLTHRPAHSEYARQQAELYRTSYEEIPGDLAWLERLLRALPASGVALLPPGQPVHQAMFPPGPSPSGQAPTT